MKEPYNAVDDKDPDEEKKVTEPHPMNELSKVSKKNSPFALLGWGLLGVVVLSVLFSAFSHSGKKIKLNDDLQTSADYKRQLAENMAAIGQLKTADSQAVPVAFNQQQTVTSEANKPPAPTP